MLLQPSDDAEARRLVQEYREAKAEARRAQSAAGVKFVLAATWLRDHGFSLRDAAKLLGVSHTLVARETR